MLVPMLMSPAHQLASALLNVRFGQRWGQTEAGWTASGVQGGCCPQRSPNDVSEQLPWLGWMLGWRPATGRARVPKKMRQIVLRFPGLQYSCLHPVES